ncbi:MAG: hypothetical protein U0Q03_02965 [Acidimicrobiales bacterium]
MVSPVRARHERPLRVVDPDARARLAALAPKLASTVAGVGTGVTTAGVLAAERVVPVHAALAGVLPQGLVQGTTVCCTGVSATSAALLAVAEASQRGAWVGVAGMATLGMQAASEAGVDVERIVAVRDRPGGLDDGTWGQVLAAMVDGFDVVLLGPGVVVRAGTARRVQTRAQARGAVLVLAGEVAGFVPDLQVRADARWDGLGDGHGHLRSRRMRVEVHGRRAPRPRRDELWFPAADGRIALVETAQVPDQLPDQVPGPVLERTG